MDAKECCCWPSDGMVPACDELGCKAMLPSLADARGRPSSGGKPGKGRLLVDKDVKGRPL